LIFRLVNNLYRNIIALIKLVLFFSVILTIFLISAVTYFTSTRLQKKLVRFFSLSTCFIFGIKVTADEYLPTKEGSLFVSNHCSYIDIVVIGSKIPVRFTPKSEIKKWPIIGWLVNMSLPVYIERKGNKAREQKEVIQNIIKGGDNIIVFPEGTTNNGRELKNFKTSLFSVVENSKIKVRPVVVKYKKIDGQNINNQTIDSIAWHGDMTFFPHLWGLMKAKKIEAEIKYLEPLSANDFESRKELAEKAEQEIRQNIYKILEKAEA